MNKTTQAVLLAATMAVSGYASAQNPTAPAARADVKAEAGTAERKAGTGEPIKPNTSATMQGNTSGTTRAEVKAQAPTPEAERKAGTGEPVKPNMSGTMQSNTSGSTSANSSAKTRAEVKAEVGTEPRRLGTGEVAKSGGTATTSAERKRMRDERRAMNKSDAKMKSDSSMAGTPKTEKAP